MSSNENKQSPPRNGSKRQYRRKGKQTRLRDNAPERTVAAVTQTGFVIRSMPFFGYKVRKQLRYYTAANFTSGAGTAGAYVLSANGMFDPDITGSGGQPMSFDQAMLFFNHYTVHNCRIRVVFQNNSSLRTTVGLFVSGSASATTSIEQLLENGDGAIELLQPTTLNGSEASFTRKLDTGRFQAVRDVMDDPNMRGDSASNPTEQAYYHLICYNSVTSGIASVDFQVVLEYDATFHEPRKGPIS